MFKLEFKELGAISLVAGVIAVGLALLGTDPLKPSGPALVLWVRLCFAGLGVAGICYAFVTSKQTRSVVSAEADATPEAKPILPPRDPLLFPPDEDLLRFRDYQLLFSDECRSDLETLRLGEADLIRLVQQEFKGHVNYFLYDLENYVLPLRAGFLVFLDKVGTNISFRAVRTCTMDEAKLQSWNDLLTVYRRGTRLAYRGHGGQTLLISNRAMLPTAVRLHGELRRRIAAHFEKYEDIRALIFPATADDRAEMSNDIVDRRIAPDLVAREVKLHLSQSFAATERTSDTFHDLENSLIDEGAAVRDLVTDLELSLQHLHKILIRFPPQA